MLDSKLSVLMFSVLVLGLVLFPMSKGLAVQAKDISEDSQDGAVEEQTEIPFGILGTLHRIEGDEYIVREAQKNREYRFNVMPTTRLDGKIQVGKKVLVSVLPNGHALIVTAMQ